jgi:hypothetical protein
MKISFCFLEINAFLEDKYIKYVGEEEEFFCKNEEAIFRQISIK